jgi:Flp pilus assembly protein TadG
VALLFAILAIPVVGLVGLAIDFGYWNQTYASLSLAASGAAMNAVKIAAAETLSKDPNAIADGVAAGKQWFVSQVGPTANYSHLIVTNGAVAVNIPPNNQPPPPASQITAQVIYTGTLNSVFGNLFSVFNYPLNVSATATQGLAPYLDVEILLDNSPSMQIGATPNDIAYMMSLTTCRAPGAFVPPGAGINGYNASGQNYAYGYQYTGKLRIECPVRKWRRQHPGHCPAPSEGGNAGKYFISLRDISNRTKGRDCRTALRLRLSFR